jgi:hypothetical protein
MKNDVSPATLAMVIALVVVVLGLLFYFFVW